MNDAAGRILVVDPVEALEHVRPCSAAMPTSPSVQVFVGMLSQQVHCHPQSQADRIMTAYSPADGLRAGAAGRC
jgi:hypothetical protein